MMGNKNRGFQAHVCLVRTRRGTDWGADFYYMEDGGDGESLFAKKMPAFFSKGADGRGCHTDCRVYAEVICNLYFFSAFLTGFLACNLLYLKKFFLFGYSFLGCIYNPV